MALVFGIVEAPAHGGRLVHELRIGHLDASIVRHRLAERGGSDESLRRDDPTVVDAVAGKPRRPLRNEWWKVPLGVRHVGALLVSRCGLLPEDVAVHELAGDQRPEVVRQARQDVVVGQPAVAALPQPVPQELRMSRAPLLVADPLVVVVADGQDGVAASHRVASARASESRPCRLREGGIDS